MFFDTETSGIGDVNLKKQRLIQLAFIITDNALDVEYNYSSYVKGAGDINTDFHKELTTDLLEREGSRCEKVLDAFFDAAQDIVDKGGMLIAHNIIYDISIIYNECEVIGYHPRFSMDFIKKNLFCTKESTREIVKLPSIYRRYKPPKLIELYVFLFDKQPDISLHNAENDVMILYLCFKKLVENNQLD